MEHGQGDVREDSGGMDTTTSSSGNQNAHVVDIAADGVSTDGEQLILGAHDDASGSLGERCFSSNMSWLLHTCAPSQIKHGLKSLSIVFLDPLHEVIRDKVVQ